MLNALKRLVQSNKKSEVYVRAVRRVVGALD